MFEVHQEHIGFGIMYLFCLYLYPGYAEMLRESKRCRRPKVVSYSVRNKMFGAIPTAIPIFSGVSNSMHVVRQRMTMINFKIKYATQNPTITIN